MHHIEDVKKHHILHDQNLLVFSETWISPCHKNEVDPRYSLDNFVPKFCNVGNGKGLVGYSDGSFRYEDSVIYETHQIIKYSTSFLDKHNQELQVLIISLYRSSRNSADELLISHIKRMIDLKQICIVAGDFNINFLIESNNMIIKELHRLNFKQMMDEPTHTQGGIIDHLYIYCPHFYKGVKINSNLITAFYTDHFGVHITLYKKEDEFRHIESTVPDYLIEQANNEGQNRKANAKRKKASTTEGNKRQHG